MSSVDQPDWRALGFTSAADKAAYEEKMRGTLSERLRAGGYVGFDKTNRLLAEAAARIDTLQSDNDRLRAEVDAANERARLSAFVPGVWKCPKCAFRLVQSNLSANTGTVTARDEAGEPCPNCKSPLWRVSWEDELHDAFERWEEQVDRAVKAEAELERLRPLAEAAALQRAGMSNYEFLITELRARANARHSGEMSDTAKLCARTADELSRLQPLAEAVKTYRDARATWMAIDGDDFDFAAQRATMRAKKELIRIAQALPSPPKEAQP